MHGAKVKTVIYVRCENQRIIIIRYVDKMQACDVKSDDKC
jgi:hypothetical protein